jgi:hypothetical protein
MSIIDLHALVGEYAIPQLAQEFDHVFDHKDEDDVTFLKWYRLMALVSHWNSLGGNGKKSQKQYLFSSFALIGMTGGDKWPWIWKSI